ncbi:MAG: UvrD-helicase domain-containing protein [Nitrospirae bacterium]|nr:UvrD-helicase domain-containing protein [Nitrospirota bacterium]
MTDIDTTFADRLKILKASAGAGKTHELTLRYAAFVLSDPEKVPMNDLRNILAITFSNNAAKEMKERILQWLKAACLDDPASIDQLCEKLSLDREAVRERSAALLEHILDNYSDFQVRTIDSFMTTVFKASAIDFGYNPDFEIIMDSSPLLVYTFDLFLRRIRRGSPDAEVLGSIVSYISEHKDGNSAYLWDPSAAILEQIKGIYQKLSAMSAQPLIEDCSAAMAAMATLKNRITAELNAINELVIRTGFKLNGNSSFKKSNLPQLAEEGRHSELIGKEFKTAPVSSLKKADEAYKKEYEEILERWEAFKQVVCEYAGCYARSFYIPYLKVYDGFSQTLDMVKKRQERVFIGDISRTLAEHLREFKVPDIYFRLGETIYHYLIDEFQDTSPVQWDDLQPLIENSLSQGGSLFVVGDTKQAIYGFRNADYTIMKKLESGCYFDTFKPKIDNLDKNSRSLRSILDFSEAVFKKAVKESTEYSSYGELSGLTDYVQEVREPSSDFGHAEVVLLYRNDEEPPEKEEIQRIIEDLRARKFSCSEIAVLTQKNEDAVRVSGWLNEKGIPFISYSNLDIRRRKITGEVISLLNFLDSPIDDHAFASFILGGIFLQALGSDGSGPDHNKWQDNFRQLIYTTSGKEPLYKAFQKSFSELWEQYFAVLFRVAGYFPLYDLAVEAFSTFRLLDTCSDEQATLVKILEVIKDFEGSGFNSLRDFLDFAEDENADTSAWNMDVPKNIEAVRVMTVHKAKGLGFPAVILLLYRSKPQTFDYFEEAVDERMRFLKCTKDICISAPELQPLYDKASEKDWVSRLNSLYVGFTRAKEEMYVVGVKAEKDTFPFDILPAGDFPKTGTVRIHRAKEEQPLVCSVLHHQNRVRDSRQSADLISVAERRRGEFLHNVLSHIVYLGSAPELDARTAVHAAIRETGAEFGVEEAVASVLGMLELSGVKALFSPMPGRKVMNEQEIVDADGGLFRIDRLVVDDDCITIVDFKTGSDIGSEERHADQVRNYMKILSPVYSGRPVAGMLVYIDLGKVATVQ